MALERGENQQNPVIRYYLDFDGTLTKQVGESTVNSDMYSFLATQETNALPYTNVKFIPFVEMVDLLKIGLLDYPELGLANGGLNFLQNETAKNAEIIIVSKNRRDYIQAVLLACGAKEELLAKIKIFDVFDVMKAGGKKGVVENYEKEHGNAGMTVICEDSVPDAKQMADGVKAAGSVTKLATLRYDVGMMPWEEIEKRNFPHEVLMPAEKSLKELLQQGVPTTFPGRVGQQYLVFKDEKSFNDALVKLQADKTLTSSFRVAGNPLTLEIKDKIKLEGAGITVTQSSETALKALPELLQQATPTKFKGKPGQYLVFNDKKNFTDALIRLSEDQTLTSSFRVAANALTIEIKDRIKLEGNNVVIAEPAKRLSR